MDAKEKRLQIADQCKAVSCLATILAKVCADYEKMMRDDKCAKAMDTICDIVGNRTAHQMEVLGDMLNGMDVIQEADEWMDPIFERAHAMFPQPTE